MNIRLKTRRENRDWIKSNVLGANLVSRSVVKSPTMNSQFLGTRVGWTGAKSKPMTFAFGYSSATSIAQAPAKVSTRREKKRILGEEESEKKREEGT